MQASESTYLSYRESRCYSSALPRLNLASAQTLSTVRGSSTILEVLIDEIIDKKITFLPLCRKEQYLGQGGQFIVHQAYVRWSERNHYIAIKQPKFDMDPNIPLSLIMPSSLKHLYGIYREIIALTHPVLKDHPNIVNLLGWSFDQLSIDTGPNLAFELASGSLYSILEEHGAIITAAEKYQLCWNVASGVDALHQCGFVHGDLKPENVLIYLHQGKLVAKLADFGLSTSETEEGGRTEMTGGTPGWLAPELHQQNQLSVFELYQADNFSFGLLVWSVALRSGRTPPMMVGTSQREIAMAEFKQSLDQSQDKVLLTCLGDAVSSLLQLPSNLRPAVLEHLFSHQREPPIHCGSITSKIHEAGYPQRENDIILPWESYFGWEVEHLHSLFHPSIIQAFDRNPGAVRGDILFPLFLQTSFISPSNRGLTKGNVILPGNKLLNILFHSAVDGYWAARVVIPVAHRYFGIEPCKYVIDNLEHWLEGTAVAGSLMALRELNQLNSLKSQEAIRAFRKNGGYNMWFSPNALVLNPICSDTEATEELPNGQTQLHNLATSGTLEELKNYLRETKAEQDLNSVSEYLETPLYLACARGSMEITSELLDQGADPSIICTEFGISCMHWIFAFDVKDQDQVIRNLVAHGANINALAHFPLPFPEYPFLLPPGTPLHWAVATSSHNAIKILLRFGADPLIRDASDPYLNDGRVRFQSRYDYFDPNMDACYDPDEEPQGLSSLDVSAMQNDPFIFEHLVSQRSWIDINQVDEEGFSALHRLTRAELGRTNTGILFSRHVFQGDTAERNERLRRILEAMKALGADLELMIIPSSKDGEYPASRLTSTTRPRTVLMLAAAELDVHLVRALLEAGASPNTESTSKEQALTCLGEQNSESGLETAKALVSYGADVNHSSTTGVTPVLRAVSSAMYDVVEFLLCKGAKLELQGPAAEENNYTKKVIEPNIFFLTGKTEMSSDNERDRSVCNLLERFVLNDEDHEQAHIFSNYTDGTGRTLLHVYASSGMSECVALLLKYGGSVNALQHNHYDYAAPEKEWIETPLDVAIEGKRKIQDDMLQWRQYRRNVYDSIMKRFDAVIDLLEKHGGFRMAADNDRRPVYERVFEFI